MKLTLKDLKTPDEHWLFGSTGRYEPEDFHLYLYEHQKKLGHIYKIHFLKKPSVVLSDAPAIQTILKSRPGRFRRVSNFETILKELGAHGVFTAEGEEWNQHRKLVNPAFKVAQLKAFFPTLTEITQRLCQTITNQGTDFNFQEMMKRYTVDITSALSFGTDINTLEHPNSELQQSLSVMFPMISSRLKMPIPYWRFFKLKKDKELDKALVFVHKQIHLFIEAARNRITAAKEDIEPRNILESLILAKDEQGKPFSDEMITGNVLTLLMAGEDTTANTLAWAMDYLVDKPALQEELYQEIQENYPANNTVTRNQLSWEDLDRFPLIMGAAQESMRLKPVAPLLFLEGLEDEDICGYQIPKGTMITALLSTASFDSALFENPEEFDPHRWSSMPAENLKKISRELMPFGGGPRLCPGRQLALTEMKIGLIEMIRQFKFVRTDGYKASRELFLLTVVPENLMVRAIPRQPFENSGQN